MNEPTRGLSRRIFSVACSASLLSASVLMSQTRAETQTESFTLAQLLSAPIPTELVAAPDGRAVAWLGDEQGRKNVWVAEAPAWRARRLTRWLADDGQELSELAWTADSRALVVTRGGDPGGNYDETLPANPTSNPAGTEQAVWLVPRAGAPRRIGEGHHPIPSPRGDRVVWILRDTLRTAPLARVAAPQILMKLRGATGEQAFSPDGRSLAFTSHRETHAFVGIYDFAARAVRWVAPGTWHDDTPRWSRDGRRLAFVRRPGSTYTRGAPLPRIDSSAQWTPWTIEVADAKTLETREAWRSPNTADGGVPGPAGDWLLQWGTGNRLVFASEQTGWIGLYAMDADSGQAIRLTPTGCEVYDVTLDRAGESALYASNCGDVDRRHIQRVSLSGGAPVDVTTGTGIEWNPQPAGDTSIVVLRSDARQPAAPALASATQPLDGWPLPDSFPTAQLVEPQQVVVRAADSTEIHLQLFLPENGTGERHPAIIHFHGGPQRQMLLGWHYRPYYHRNYAFNQYMASRGFVVVSVNYRGGVGYGRAFREAPNRGRAGASEYQDALAAAAYLRSRTDVDSARIGLWGGSYGGYMTALGLARNSDLFRAGFDLHGVHDYATESGATLRLGVTDSALAFMRGASAIGDVSRWRSPVLLVQGDDDRNVQFQQTVDLAVRLRRLGVHVEELVFPDEIHDFLRWGNWLRAYQAGAGFLASELRR
jgi:dipeptidyl aminopeptidase/acylaminoacyl peptidase